MGPGGARAVPCARARRRRWVEYATCITLTAGGGKTYVSAQSPKTNTHAPVERNQRSRVMRLEQSCAAATCSARMRARARKKSGKSAWTPEPKPAQPPPPPTHPHSPGPTPSPVPPSAWCCLLNSFLAHRTVYADTPAKTKPVRMWRMARRVMTNNIAAHSPAVPRSAALTSLGVQRPPRAGDAGESPERPIITVHVPYFSRLLLFSATIVLVALATYYY